MPFPDTPREIYGRNPLKQVICQLRFPTILQIASESPTQFQNSIRQAYPFYEQEHPAFGVPGVPKEVADLLANLPLGKVLQQSSHRFTAENRDRIISLSQQSVAVSETRYRRWESMRDAISEAEAALQAYYRPAFYTRVGLRYINAIDREALGLEDVPWTDLLNHRLVGLLGMQELGGEISSIKGEYVISIPDVPKASVHIVYGLAKSQDTQRTVFLIDSDFFTDERSTKDDAFGALEVFNNMAGRLFRWTISPRLRTALRPEPVSP